MIRIRLLVFVQPQVFPVEIEEAEGGSIKSSGGVVGSLKGHLSIQRDAAGGGIKTAKVDMFGFCLGVGNDSEQIQLINLPIPLEIDLAVISRAGSEFLFAVAVQVNTCGHIRVFDPDQ